MIPVYFELVLLSVEISEVHIMGEAERPVNWWKGVGRKLLDKVINWAKENDFSLLKLDVADFNIAAIQLYEKVGFKNNGIKGSLPAPREHVTEHQKELTLFTTQFGWEGDNGVGERLILQIMAGTKTATACPKAFYSESELTEIYQSVGKIVTVLDKNDQPRCKIRQLEVFETNFGAPDPKLVWGEGHGKNPEAFQKTHLNV